VSTRAPARPAATIVLLRDGERSLEVLLTRRPRHFRFMGGALVFPGGALDEEDLDPRWAGASALSAREAAAQLAVDDERRALGFYVGSLREAFEEVGLLLVHGDVRLPPTGPFLEHLLASGAVLATDLLVPVGRWVTPADSSLRFDTRFFLARAPEGWEPRPHRHETDGCMWLEPRAVLEQAGTGAEEIAPPTVDTLRRLTAYARVDDAIAAGVRGAWGGSAPAQTAVLSPLVRAVLAPNSGPLTGPGTNTYVIGGERTFVVDPGVADAGFVDTVSTLAGDVEAILLTHRHDDHVGGVAALVARTEAPVRALGEGPAGGVPVAPLRDGEMLDVPGVGLRALGAPGHARDHVCFLLLQEMALFTGDLVLGEGTSMIDPPDGDMASYLDSLARMGRLGVTRIYPGHFRPLDEPDVFARYIEHRRERESTIVRAIPPRGATLEEIVARAYDDTPPDMHSYAARSALAHLEMLLDNGRVARAGDRWLRAGRAQT
jgi:glyoxylase-like metal-dependent hydrolase (beta-lactamase superfamily II)/8-oxo-dGTP pyrophosphatase MutT (NUDIX family)